jgi:hypothetical protein
MRLKIFCALVLGLVAPRLASAAAVMSSVGEPAAAVREIILSSQTVKTVDISSHTGTEVVVSTPAMFTTVLVQNLDGTCAVFCSELSGVLTDASSSNSGFKIWPYQSVVFKVVPGSMFYCRNNGGTSGTTKAAVGKWR